MTERSDRYSEERQALFDVFGRTLNNRDRLLYPAEEVDVDTLVISVFRSLRERSRRIVLVDGAFDVPHPSHEWYLRYCKLLGAQAMNPGAGRAELQESLSDGSVSLAVTVDADEKIANKKSGKSEKGGVQRPIYPWTARADRIAGYSYEIYGRISHTADLVTVEGDLQHKGTLLESSLHLACGLGREGLLDNLVVYGEHKETIGDARRMGVEPIIIPDGFTDFEINPQTERPWSSSAIIRRAQGGLVKNPATRPERSMQ